MAAICEKLPNIDFVMSMGLPEDAPQAIDDLVQVDAMLRGTRKPLLVAPRDGHMLPRMQEMAALAGEEDSFGIYAMPCRRSCSTRTRQQGHRLRRAAHPAHLGAGAEQGATGPRSITGAVVVGNAEMLGGLVLHQARQAGRAVRLRASAPAPWTCAP